MLLSLQELAQGMADDFIAAGFEANPSLKSIEIAVELLAQGNGHADGQHTGRLVAFGTSSGPSGLHVLESSEWNWSKMGGFRYLFYTKDLTL